MPLTWTLASGSLPPGLTMSAAGVISGTPTTNGSYPFSVSVTDSTQNSTTGTVTIVIGSSFSITTTTLPNGTVGLSYSQTLAAAGGTSPLIWSATGVPAGLTLNATTGVLSGTPTATGTATIAVTVTDSATPTANTATASLSLTVVAPAFTITTTSPLPPGTVGIGYSQVLTAAGGIGTLTWSATPASLPAGLTLSSGGTLSGTPTAAGSFTIVVTVTDSTSATATARLDVVISVPALTITDVQAGCFIATAGRPFPDPSIKPSPLPAGCPTTYKFAVVGGTAPFTWSATGLPTGLNLAASGTTGGTLSGTAPPAGTISFTVIVTDSLLQKGVLGTSITVAALGKPTSVNITLGGNLGPNIGAGLQPSVVLSMGNTFPFSVSGKVTVSFVSSVGGINSLVTFAGGQTATFNIPAGGQTANVGPITTGTQAGTITLTATQFTDDFGNDMTPQAPTAVSYTVAPGVPVITRVAITSNQTCSPPTCYIVSVTGYSTPRNMTSAVFHFTPTSTTNLGAGVGTLVDVTVQVGSQFTSWYSNAGSNPFGSSFVMTVPFTFSSTGASSAAPFVSVTANMTNSVGASATSAPPTVP